MELAGRTALVTGAAAGIGRATALALADAGVAAISLADIDEPGLAETAQGIEERGAAATARRVDVTDAKQQSEWFAFAETRHGGIDIVFNNAGMMGGDPQWPATPLERIRRVVTVNLIGVMFGTRLAIDALERRGGGVVVNTASPAGFGPMPNDPMYSSTKEAIINFTQSCAPLAESHGIRVNALLPGVTETAILAKSGDGKEPAMWLKPLLDSVTALSVDDIPPAVLELIADDTRAGECLFVNNPARPGAEKETVRLADPAAFHAYAASRASSSD